MKDVLGDRMKYYEGMEAGRRCMPLVPVVARLDGRGFSRFTRGMERPFDPRMSKAMQDLTKWLVEETNASMGYTQSDEITLTWYSGDIKTLIYFDGRIQKMVSLLAAEATLKFFELIQVSMPEYASRRPRFDCRVWQLPTLQEAANCFLWREWDATKNSVQMAGHHYFSHKSLHKLHTGQIKDRLINELGVNWNEYPAFFKRGSYFQRRRKLTPFTAAELAKLPPKHQAHQNPDLQVDRSVVEQLDMPVFQKVTNRVDVIFHGVPPIVMDLKDAAETPPVKGVVE